MAARRDQIKTVGGSGRSLRSGPMLTGIGTRSEKMMRTATPIKKKAAGSAPSMGSPATKTIKRKTY